MMPEADPGIIRMAEGRFTLRGEGYSILALLAFSLGMAWMLWCKLKWLTYMDPAWWLHECSRFAVGEMPYRDFFWPYPPLALFLFGTSMRWFGISFQVAQILTDLLSLAIVFLAYRLLRYLVPRGLALIGCLMLIAVCGTSQTYFSLFSLLSYSPALQVAVFGLLLLLWGLLRYVEHGRFSVLTVLLLSTGSTIAMLAKQEPMLAVPAMLILLAMADRRLWFERRPWKQWARQYALLLTLCLAPTAIVVVLTGIGAGFANLQAGLGGYGQATTSCPWWPTGIGLFSAGAGIGQVMLLIAIFALLRPKPWRSYFGRWSTLFRAALVPGAACYIGYEYRRVIPDLLAPAPIGQKINGMLSSLLATTPILRPFLWSSIFYWIFLLIRGLRNGGRFDRRETALILFLTAPVLMSVRSLFGTTNAPEPNITAICFLPLLLITPYLLLRLFQLPEGKPVALQANVRDMAGLVVGGLMGLYMLTRIIGGFGPLLSDRNFSRLETAAGPVWVGDGPTQAGIYNYIMEHTTVADPVLELPYGGGMSFATGRRSPVPSGIFTVIPLTKQFQLLDLRRIQEHPPSVIVAQDARNYGTSLGTKMSIACPFPRFVWTPLPDAATGADDAPAIVNFIQANYRADRKIGQWLMLRPVSPVVAY